MILSPRKKDFMNRFFKTRCRNISKLTDARVDKRPMSENEAHRLSFACEHRKWSFVLCYFLN